MSTYLARVLRAVCDPLASLALHRRNARAKSLNRRGSEFSRAGDSRVESLEHRTLLSTYYVNSSGNDSNSGTSTAAPWATITRANSASLHPGDTLLFAGGQTFNGQVTIGSGDSGSSSAPVTVGSYGSGRARINNAAGRGIYVLDSQYINIQNLIITGAGKGSGSTYGIKIENNLTNSTTLSHVHVDNVDVSGFGQIGIYAFVWNSGCWYNDVRITNSVVHNNVMLGIATGAGPLHGLENLYIGHCDVYGTTGNGFSPTDATGSGILITGVDGGTVEWCTAHDNAIDGNGSGGLWSSNSTRMLLQYNEVYNNHTNGQRDGDGMGFDINTSFSIMQYNYVHDNDGSGLQLDNWIDNGGETNNVIRYNIAVNNGRKNAYAGLQIWGQILNSAIYDNVVFVSPISGAMGIKVHNADIPSLVVNNVQFLNNVVVTMGGHAAVSVSSNALNGAKNLIFMGNDYWAASGAFNISYGGKGYSSLGAWQSATKQEMSNGNHTGFQLDPQLVDAGADPTFGDATKLATLSGYKLRGSSPLIKKGLGVPSLGVAAPSLDFFGVALPASLIDVGANQFNGIIEPPPPPPSPWSHADIGSVGKAGNSTSANGVFTVTGSGADIFASADAFQYDYQTLTGDGQIIAQVSSLAAANAWAKAGVMVRDGNTAGSKHVSMLVSNNGLAEFERRWGTDGTTGTTDVTAPSPHWVKLVRQGNNFTGYISSDGKTWTQVAATQVTMNSTVEIGLVVTSHDSGLSATATFSNVAVVN